MLVVTRNRTGWDGLGAQYPFSRTHQYGPARATVGRAQRAAGGWTDIRPLRGLGAENGNGLDIPSWVWWGAGGLVAGAAAGWFFLKK